MREQDRSNLEEVREALIEALQDLQFAFGDLVPDEDESKPAAAYRRLRFVLCENYIEDAKRQMEDLLNADPPF